MTHECPGCQSLLVPVCLLNLSIMSNIRTYKVEVLPGYRVDAKHIEDKPRGHRSAVVIAW